MKYILAFIAFVLSLEVAAEPTHAEIQEGIKYGVTFQITPSADGNLVSCVFKQANDLQARVPAEDFRPSDRFIEEACDTMSRGNWRVQKSESGEIAPVYDFCFWSEVIPDKPVCPARLAN